MIEQILDQYGKQLALIIRSDFTDSGIRFFTPDDYPLQLAYMNRPNGYKIDAHIHKNVNRQVNHIQEVLIIRKGKIRVDLYSDIEQYHSSRFLYSGDIIMLVSGGHGFEIFEDAEIVEVKQGPYSEKDDKTRFSSVPHGKITIDSENI